MHISTNAPSNLFLSIAIWTIVCQSFQPFYWFLPPYADDDVNLSRKVDFTLKTKWAYYLTFYLYFCILNLFRKPFFEIFIFSMRKQIVGLESHDKLNKVVGPNFSTEVAGMRKKVLHFIWLSTCSFALHLWQ